MIRYNPQQYNFHKYNFPQLYAPQLYIPQYYCITFHKGSSTPNDYSTLPDSLWWNHTVLGPVTDGVPTGRRGRPVPATESVDEPPPQKVSGRLPVGT